ncbi:TRAP transporter large permease [Xenorhabdus szentirmaii]|uniref:TRAP transporter large permease protein n=1 Tax=Xenorhabdus szentirmaii DSM 16338 TaxID=1427518 RepID=W1J4F2_9GAMM|nr:MULTISPECIES: TRAP transporter large permease subunit [Xenorhabdus]MBD2780920.1 TRAP transporter large permease subunit [Xenorhabdus sp. 38]MBD2792556.1 TRAP transporter large permease subunit [Xenorhabdus sp. CUL]MBD2805002.1 TRAP transporter large permease subunit [Xenorhabdus sp. ZM]MBD2819200.1 TRAP transporter large permease subunit [Xenorhabdus sp. 42]MBD2823521.1 TRAP transporter large permease subunit [Xenorhabdus sp. 5]
MDWYVIAALFGVFAILLALSVPVSFAIGLSSLVAIMLTLPLETAITVVAQRMVAGVDNFSLLAIPFFILAGNLMNQGGIAARLIHLAKMIGGRLPGSLMHVNIMANMLFGAISGSAVASAAAVGGTMAPMEKKEGYDPAQSAAVNIASCPCGLLIPPSNTLIVYSLVSGGTSIAALFLAGYIPGIIMGISLMIVSAIIARRRNYPVASRPTWSEFFYTAWKAIPSLMLIVVIMGGIIGGVFTATEASAIAVLYSFVLAVIIYREVSVKQLPKIVLDSAITTSIVLLLIGASMGMSWAMTNADLPYLIADRLMAISDNPLTILLVINVILLIVGTFMDMTPAVLIFTPIFLPVAVDMGIDPVHFGIIMTFNLAIGICTPPVGSALFVGCSIGEVGIDKVLRPLIPMYIALIAALALITYLPQLSLWLPELLLNYIPA